MWYMVNYIKTYIAVDSTAAELMMADNLERAVRCGLFVDACVLADATWPDAHATVSVCDANTLLYHMASRGEVGLEHVHIFARVDTMMPLHVKALLRHARCPPSLCRDIMLTRNWIRRRAWMLALVQLRRVHNAAELLYTVVAIDPISLMIMEFV